MDTKNLQNTKEIYQSPSLKVVEFEVESGFATSGFQNSIGGNETIQMFIDEQESCFETFSHQDVSNWFN